MTFVKKYKFHQVVKGGGSRKEKRGIVMNENAAYSPNESNFEGGGATLGFFIHLFSLIPSILDGSAEVTVIKLF